MSRLVRMDGSGHTTLAEWTDADDAAFAEAVEEFDAQIGARLHRHRDRRAGQGHARARSSRARPSLVIMRRPIAGG